MLPVIIQFLTAKFESLSYLDTVFGLGDSTTVNEEKVIGVYENGELVQLNFDEYKSVIYLLKNGNIGRTTIEHPAISDLEQITETYPLRAVIYSQGLEDMNCSSASQSIAQGIKKNLSGLQEDLRAAINAENVIIRITDTDLDKNNVWKSQTSLPSSLKDTDILIAVDFEITVTGDEQCFAGEPCEAGEFVFDNPAQSFCNKTKECLGISDTGSTTKYLNERGQFVVVASGGGVWGAITGNISAQTDLQSALGGKFNSPSGTTAQYIRGDGTLATFPTAISSFTNDAGYITASSVANLTNKTGNISQWTNDSGYITANQGITLSGDVSGSGATAITTTLATVNAAPGTYGSGSTIPQITVNAKGLVTSVNLFNNTPDFGFITNLPTTISGYGITDTTGQLLTGLSITGSTIVGTDSILSAFGKLQNQINGVLGGAIYQGTWNATTNSPALASGTGTKGYYYVVNVAGSTNLDGTTDWKVGDWAIFNGAIWQKVDNTDAVSSVNSAIGAVVITTTGTANRISVSGGSGLVPTIDIDAAYVGQSSITTLGTIATGTWTGTTIAIANGGTGQTTAANAINALLPTQTGNSGKYLTTNGTVASWASASAGITIDSTAITSGGSSRILFESASNQVSESSLFTYLPTSGMNLGMTAGTGTQSPVLTVTGAAHTAYTASTESIGANFNFSATKQFATGALALQREIVFQAPTYGFIGASTLTTAATVAITGAPIKGTNTTLGSTAGLYIQSNAVGTATNAYGLLIDAPTGATNTYAAKFTGGGAGGGATLKLDNGGGANSLEIATNSGIELLFTGNGNNVNISQAGNGAILMYTASAGIYFSTDGASSYGLNVTSNKVFVGGNTAATAFLHLIGGTTAAASLRIANGAAPTSPNSGDIWFDGTDLKMRVGATTKTFTLV